MVATSRRLRVLLPSPDGRSAATSQGRLPCIDIDLPVDATTTAGLAAWLPTIGLAPWVVDCIVDQTTDADLGDIPRRALVELTPAVVGWPLPVGWSWAPCHEVPLDDDVPYSDVAGERLAEWVGQPVPELRAAWARRGWFERASAWIDDALAAAGRAPSASIVQHRHWGISAILRVDLVDGGRCWFKASFPRFHHEPAVTELLGRLAGGATPNVVATRPDDGWLIVDDLGATTVESAADSRAAIDHLVTLQRALAEHHVDLAATGCRHRPLAALPAALAAAWGSPAFDLTEVFAGVDRDRLVAGLEAAVATIAGAGFPEVLAHGDFHPGNVACSDGEVVVFDWSDACISSPIVDLATWESWYTDDPERDADVWRWFRAAWRRELGVDVEHLDRRSVDAVAGAFHVLSFVGILEGLEPHRRVETVDGLDHFGGLLVRSLA